MIPHCTRWLEKAAALPEGIQAKMGFGGRWTSHQICGAFS
jgi:hypothetical protein